MLAKIGVDRAKNEAFKVWRCFDLLIHSASSKVTEEGHMEATTYDKFACFCKSKTDEKVAWLSGRFEATSAAAS